jgi:glycosyltransferase involved in cell wall biosynthesis
LRTILVCEAQVPFVRGGAEYHVRALVAELQQQGYDAELVSVPFKWYPKEEILTHAAAWRLLDLSESNGRPVDLVIATKFPTYFVRHPRKVAWLIHQYRAAYELAGTMYSDFHHTHEDVALRERIVSLDTIMLRECRHVFANAETTAARARRFNGVAATALYHPPRLAPRLHPGPMGNYVLSVGRLESVKRVELAVRAMAYAPKAVSLKIAGTGTRDAELRALAERLGLADRIQFLGEVGDDDLIELYRGALGVIFPPYDEDYGYVTLEAFLSGKPVITTTDAGGPTEFVIDGVNGRVTAPEPDAIGEAVGFLAADAGRAASLGDAGRARARQVTWTGVIDALVSA